MPMKGVELEVTDGITEHSSRVALKGVFSNFGDVVACWVPPIDRRGVDRASVRFSAVESAEAAKAACDAGQVFLQGMMVKAEWRSGGGRRVGNSDLGSEAGGDQPSMRLADREQPLRALRDRDRRRSKSRRRSRSRGGRRSRSRGRRERSRDRRSRSRKDRRRSRSRDGTGADAVPAAPPVGTEGLPDWLRGVETPMQESMGTSTMLPGGGIGIPPPGTLGGNFGSMPTMGGAPDMTALTGTLSGAAGGLGGAAVPVYDPEEDARKRAEIERKKQERAAQMKRGPGVAQLVQAALKSARAQPTVPKKEELPKDKRKAQQIESDAESDDEETKARKEKEEHERRLKEAEEAQRAKEEAERQAKEREKREQERRERLEQARREEAAALKALQEKEALTREQRIKASVEAAKRQQAERAAAKAAREAADNLYDNMPQPDVVASQAAIEVRQKEAEERQKKNSLSSLPPEDRTKVVFLDVDGVLRPARAGGFDTIVTDGDTARVDTSDFFPSAMKALRHIVERTGALIVLSAEWRRSESLRTALTDIFEKHRLRPWGSMTTTKSESEPPGTDPVRQFADRRAREITQWLGDNGQDLKGWVVLDDINIAIADEAKKASGKSVIGPRLVQTWPLCGLTMGNAKTAVRILNGEMINKVVVERPVAPAPGGLGVSGAATPVPGMK